MLKLVESTEIDKKSALLALETLAKFDKNILKNKVKNLDQHLLTLLKDSSKELSLKSTAIEMILKTSPSVGNVREILKILKETANNELTAIVLQKWLDLSEADPYLNSLFRYSYYLHS